MLNSEKIDKMVKESEEILQRMKSATFSAEDYKSALKSLVQIQEELGATAKSIKELVSYVQNIASSLEDKLGEDKMKQLEKVTSSIEALRSKLNTGSEEIVEKNLNAIKPVLNSYSGQIIKKTITEVSSLKTLIYISLAMSGLMLMISLILLIK